MTAGPTPLPPAVSAGDGRADPLPPRAGLHRGLRAGPGAAPRRSFRPATTCSRFAASGTGAMESAVANLVVPGEPALVASARQVRRALGASSARPTAPTSSTWSSSGARRIDPARLDEALAGHGEPPRAVFATQSETSTGVVHDVRALAEVARAPRRDALRRRDLGPRRRRPAPGRVGGGRGRLGLAEVADVPAGPRLRLGLASGPSRLAAESPGRRYYFDWARTAAGQREEPANSPFTPAVTLWRALDVALGLIIEEGLARSSPATPCWPAPRGPGSRRIGLERFGPDDPEANVVTAARLPEGIDGAAVPKLMRDRLRSHGRRRAGASEGPDRSHRPLRLLRRLRHRRRAQRRSRWPCATSATTCEPGAAPGAAQRVFAEAGARRSRSVERGSERRPRGFSSRRRSPTSGVDLLRANFEVDLGLEMGRR